MSRLTAAQVIALGDYLEPDFEPSTLTISQLLGVLGFHNISYPTPYSKAKLVQVFNDEVKRRAVKFKKERLRKENSIASDDGIKDGVTGEYLGRPPVIRRSSRRLSKAPPDPDVQDSPPKPDPPKRRRSSAQPRLGDTSRRAPAPIQPAVAEESEPEEQQEPLRKVGRTKKSVGTAGAQSRRVSQAEDSGWEDNNIFQSGAESSSPLRPSPVRPKGRRSSLAPRKSRKSMSAPPNISPSSSPSKSTFVPTLSPPQSNFEPEIPQFDNSRLGSPPRRTSGQWNFVSTVYSPPSRTAKYVEEYEDMEVPLRDEDEDEDVHSYSDPIREFDEAMDEISEDVPQEVELSDEDNRNAMIQQRIADAGIVAKLPQDSLLLEDVKPMSALSRVLLFGLFSVLAYFTYEYKLESASIGYCDAGSDTNLVLEGLKVSRHLVVECNQENRTTLHDPFSVPDSPLCPMLPVTPFFPDSCTQCPEHAVCSGHAVTCEKAYILKSPFLLSFLSPSNDPSQTTLSTSVSPSDMAWKVLSELCDGLPGLGSIAFPPTCVEDPRRKMHIGVLGKGIEALLAQRRGTLLCNAEANQIIKDEDGGEARRWGFQVNALKETIRNSAHPQLALPNFDDLFNEAVQQLVQWGGVLLNEDSKGDRYLAHKTPSLSWTCKLTVKSRDTWNEWRGTVATLTTITLFFYASSARRNKKKLESKRTARLVQIALESLQNQELAHYTDPVNAPQPYLSSIQLRDLVLQDETSVSIRQNVWAKVEKIVEGNANVRANMEEVFGGDELRVWRWVGGSIDTGRDFKQVEHSANGEAEAE
ncbi:Man1-Src1p-C-terminal domain-containing protein [Rhodocollybia butyracea]|uniref:Man1-Src1p-C-terminal domain-containing protein n=1 Tax=Rhodocollybia butyracea TaxID=206335 RepID=A0A9P5PPE1_9AGAR|nr:Man1-Src1p-C-terminal domain-containing protein [Rhodocollybia butyracea]